MEEEIRENQIPVCCLCENQNQYLKKYSCTQKSIEICYQCRNFIISQSKSLQYVLAQDTMFFSAEKYFIFPQYNQKIYVSFNSHSQFYKLKRKYCEICQENGICSKLCSNKHYFCLKCVKKYVQTYFQKTKIKCPNQFCDQEIDHHLIAQFVLRDKFHQWKALNFNLFCPNRHCNNIVKFEPHKQLTTQIKRIDQEQSICTSCKISICNMCWNQFTGNINQHYKICQSQKFRKQLLEKYLEDNSVTQCPKCKFYSEQACSKMENQIQTCQLCETSFCLICKTGDIQLFMQEKSNFSNQCFNCNYKKFSESNNCQAKIKKIVKQKFYIPLFISKLCTLIMIILIIPFQQFMQVGAYVSHYAEDLLSTKNFSEARYFLCFCGPVIAILIILSIFVVYIVMFIPLFIINFKERVQNEIL